MQEIVVKQEGGIIQCDFESAKKILSETLEEYKSAVFTEETKKDAKAIVADLRKNKKAFSDRIKEVKAEYMKPYDDFYTKASELVAMFDEPINLINDQVTAFEQKRIEEKRQLIQEIYDEVVGGTAAEPYMTLEQIYQKKWENATTSKKTIYKEIEEWRDTAISGVDTIKDMKSEVEDTALEMFSKSLNVSESIVFITKHEQQKKEILERERERVKREEEERIRREEREKLEAELRAEAEKEAAIEQAFEETKASVVESFIPEKEPEAEIHHCLYQISLSEAEKESLEMYMNSIGLEYKCLDDETKAQEIEPEELDLPI